MQCQAELMRAGKPYPRTCPQCELGPCAKGLDHKAILAELNAKRNEAARAAKDRIVAGSISLQAAADELTKRVEIFTGYLAALPGKVAASITLTEPGGASWEIRFDREGGVWGLSYAPAGKGWLEYRPIREASLNLRMLVASHAFELLMAVDNRQKELIDSITTATKEFDYFFSQLPEHKKNERIQLNRKVPPENIQGGDRPSPGNQKPPGGN